ncbi:hypothetical protein [Rhodococcus zopfii]|uniref:hypothetical protein n=1 Tax=Rhodococcus zopfii TaxID=43772 RepID=UPI000932D84C|nr:hypothetical protein [Rhodococcus zopfii]
MNSNDGDNTCGNRLFRWYAHPLTTVLAIVVSTPMLVHFLEPIHAATLLGGLVSFVATCANAYRAQGPTK